MSIRCDNCGWSNPDSAVTCEKCNQPLVIPEKPAPDSTPVVDTRATVIKENIVPENAEPAVCPKCRYPIAPGSEYCPNCGYTVAPARPAPVVQQPEAEPATVAPAPAPVSPMNQTVMDGSSSGRVPVSPMNQTVMDGSSSGRAPVSPMNQTVMEGSAAVRPQAPVFKQTVMEGAAPVKVNLKATVREASKAVEASQVAEPTATVPEIKIVPAESYGPDNLVISCENGVCYVEPASDVPVYVRLTGKTALNKGAEIIIGTRKFIVE